jgi:hypothetical protein
MRFVLIRFLAIVLAAAAVLGQQQDVIGLADFPVPAWPANGVVDASLKDRYVFVDLAKNEYVIAYPENLGTDAFATNPGRMKITRYDMLRNVTPAVSLAVTPAGTGYKYSYTVANGAGAVQSIDTFVLALTTASATAIVRPPDGWFGIVQRNRTFKVKNPEWIQSGVAAVWSFQKMDQVVLPGQSKGGFEIESNLRPGFSVAYLRKSEPVDVKYTTQGNVPKEVKDQLDQLLQIEYNSRTVLTLAPKFEASGDSRAVAEDFVQGIVTLSRAGVLDLSSEFVRMLMAELTAVKPGTPAALKLPVPPQTAAEAELLNAVKLSLPVGSGN